MKLDRNINKDGKGKYALVRLRGIQAGSEAHTLLKRLSQEDNPVESRIQGVKILRPMRQNGGDLMPEPTDQREMVNSFEADDCCGRHIAKASRKGDLDKSSEWTCPKCSVPWHPQKISETHRHWSPEIAIAILRV